MNSVTICRCPALCRGRAFYGNKSGASESHLEAAPKPATTELYDIPVPFFKPFPAYQPFPDGGGTLSDSPPHPAALTAPPAIPSAYSVIPAPGLNRRKNPSPDPETLCPFRKDNFMTPPSSCDGRAAVRRAKRGYACPPVPFPQFAPVPRPPNG